MLTDGLSLKTTNGANLTIHVQGDKTYVNAARILSTDYIISNGVVHIIDRYADFITYITYLGTI
jgi:uncharacterized surface protein with fasciclin (FAS1) repeats